MKKSTLNISLYLVSLLTVNSVFGQTKSHIKTEPLIWEYVKRDDKNRPVEKKENFEARVEKNKIWTKFVFNIIRKETPELLGQNVADDVEYFCPKYRRLNEIQRMNMWGQLIASMSLRESDWFPTNRTAEPQLGIDKITHKTVYSEGLLQLSYQDSDSYKNNFDCEFDYEYDRQFKDPKDFRKTILNPYKNLRCGILILNHKIHQNRKIMLDHPYWSSLGKKHKNSAVKWISRQTRSLSFCR